jgi:hypothetical protein
MSSETENSGAEPLAHHSDNVLLPSGRGNIIVYLGKEALLSWFTGIRSKTHQETANRLYHLGHPRVLFKTSVYQLVEVFTKVRYEKSAITVGKLRQRLVDSIIRVFHGNDKWDTHRQVESPKQVFDGATKLFEDRPQIEFSFPEAALVLSLARENRNRNVPVSLFTFDGTLATLADTFDVTVLPYSTPLRDDGGRE